jgi:two-component system, NtrC family, response regulator AtoC
MPTLLVIDDEEFIQYAFRQNFRAPTYTLLTASTAAEGVEMLRSLRPDAIILDVHLPDASGLEGFEQVRAVDARIPVILITGHGTTALAIEAMKRGAYDYLLKPLELLPLRELVNRACASSRLMSVPALVPGEAPEDGAVDVLVGRCPAMQDVYKAIGRVASQNVNVLILGESGTGKELVARAIYQHSHRADRPFLAINCAAIPESLLESELFGHEKGSFSGADRKRIGKFEQCSGGTLFLDEVGDMTPATQAKVLRVLQDQTFERVGGNETIRTDVRVIAATNRDLERMTATGQFRGDLFFRLNVFTIRLPPLRERGEDLPLLVEYHVRRFAQELSRQVHAVPAETMDLLRRYRWPGNVRELQSVLKQGLLQMGGSVLLPEFLPAALLSEVALPVPSAAAEQVVPAGSVDEQGPALFDWERFVCERLESGSEQIYAQALAIMEREVISRVLRHCGGNQAQAARLLGITRTTLRTKIRALRITIDHSVWTEDQDES